MEAQGKSYVGDMETWFTAAGPNIRYRDDPAVLVIEGPGRRGGSRGLREWAGRRKLWRGTGPNRPGAMTAACFAVTRFNEMGTRHDA